MKVVHINDSVPGAVYVGRAMPRRGLKASKWANPYRLGLPGVRGTGVTARREVIRRYRADLMGGPARHLLADLTELRNAPALACWCRHDGEERTDDNACHADVLIDLLDRHTDDELRAMGGAK